MKNEPATITRRMGWLGASVVVGAVLGAFIGWLDLSATEVQGTLLFVMLVAFAGGMVGRASPWIVGAAVALGMTSVHLVAWAVSAAPASNLGSVMAVIPAVVAAYVGRAMGMLVSRAAESLPYGRGDGETEAAELALPWYAHRAASRTLLAVIICGCAVIGLPIVYYALLAVNQPNAWWVAIVWQNLTLMGWVALTPFVIRLRGDRSAAPTADGVATVGVQVLTLAAVHAIILVLLTGMLFIPLGDSGIVAQTAHAFGAYLPLDIVTFVLLRTLAYVSDADRHLRQAADRSAARAASLSAELNTSRLSALKAQLRPHFLFNAINSAVALSLKADARGAASILTSLADLLRYVLADKTGTVRLGDELAFIERYLAVERTRFPDRLIFSIEADTRTREALVPHLLLQPLVENAVQHGIAARISGGEIHVRATTSADILEIKVEDDGAGIDNKPAPVPGDVANGNGGHGVGLANTRARLSLIYGDAATLVLTSRTGGGTICRVILPLKFV